MIVSKKLLQPVLPKEDILNLDYIKFVLLAAASSTKFGVIKEIEHNGEFITQGNINALIVAPFGTGKTSQLIKIHNVDIHQSNDLSFPGLIGTITKDGRFLKGDCTRAAGKLLVIDESQSIGRDVRNAMNSILEFPHRYTRALGYMMNSYINEKGPSWYVKGEENQFHVYSKFSCIASSMYVTLKKSIDLAWYSRFIPIRLDITDESIRNLTSGRTSFPINASTFKGDFTFSDYLQFHDYYFDNYDKSIFKNIYKDKKPMLGFLARDLQHIVRLAAFTASTENRNVINFEDAKNIYDKYFTALMYNRLVAPLTESEFIILSNINKTEEELSLLLGITQPSVSYLIQGLLKKGLLKIPETTIVKVKNIEN